MPANTQPKPPESAIPSSVPEQFEADAEARRHRPGVPFTNQWAVLAGLRFVLAFIVLCHHLSAYTDTRWPFEQFGRGNAITAVMAFFVISGYSMAHSLTHNADTRAFYERRFWRIYPCYLWALILAVAPSILFATVFLTARPGFSECPTAHQFLLSAVFLQGMAMGVVPGNGVIWSLSVEVWLYLLSPLFFRSSLKLLYAVIAASAIAFCAHSHLSRLTFYDEIYGVDLACFAWAFVGGFAFYRFRERFSYVALLLPSLALACYYEAGSSEQFGPLTMAATVTAIYYGDRWKMTARTARCLSWLGDISLCLYLVHVPVLDTMYGLGYKSGLVMVPACLAFAILTYYVVDLPVRAYVRRRNMPRKALANPA